MGQFVDLAGRTHTLVVTVATLAPLREAGIGVDKLVESWDSLGTLLFGDLERLCETLWLVRSPASVAVTREEFNAGMDGPSLERGGMAFVEAVVSFSPRSKVAELMRGRVKVAFEEVDRQMMAAMGSSAAAGSSAD